MTARSEAGALFQVRVGTPRMSSSSISKSWPGAVSAALASARSTGRRSCALVGGAHGLPGVPAVGPPAAVVPEDGGPVVGELRHDSRMSWRARWPPFFPGPPCRPRGTTAGELLEGRHVDRAVVEVVLDLGQLGGQEPPVGTDRIAGQGHRAGLRDMGGDEVERLAGRPRPGSVRTPRSRRAGRWPCAWSRTKSSIAASCPRWRRSPGRGPRPRGQVVVGDQGGDLHDDVAVRLEPRHLQIHPDQHARSCYRSPPGQAAGCPSLVMSGDAARPPAPARRRSCRSPATRAPGDAGADLRRPDRGRALPAGAGGPWSRRGWPSPSRRATPAWCSTQWVGRAPRGDLPQCTGVGRLGVPGGAPGRPGQPRPGAGLHRALGGSHRPARLGAGSEEAAFELVPEDDLGESAAGPRRLRAHGQMTAPQGEGKKVAMQSLVGMDAAFLSLETPTTPMHVGVALVLDPPEGTRSLFSPSTRYAQIRRVIQQRLHLVPPFRQRALRVPFGLPPPGVGRRSRVRARRPPQPGQPALARREGGARSSAFPPGEGRAGPAEVVVELEVGVVGPDRVVEAEGRPGWPAGGMGSPGGVAAG